MAEPTSRGGAPSPSAWAAPDSRVEEPAATAVPVPGLAARPQGSRGRRGPETPVPLRPMTVGDRVDGALRILELAPATVVALAAVALVPVHLATAVGLSGRILNAAPEWDAMFGRPLVTVLTEEGSTVGIAFVLVALESLALSFVTAGVTILVTGWYVGIPRSAGHLIRSAAARLPALAAAWFLVHLAEALFAIALVVPALLPMIWFALVAPVIAVEGRGPIAALRRSFDLTKRSLSIVAGTCLLVAFIDLLLRASLAGIALVFVETDLAAGRAIVAVIALIVRLVTVPFVAGAAAMLYLDLRVRLEGLDITLAADERLPVGP